MSALKDQLFEDMKNAMRAHDTVKLGVVRYLISEVKNFEIDNGPQDDAGVLKVIAREVKKMKDALEEFKKADRQDIVEEETAKIAVMETYLPQQMGEADLEKIVKETVEGSEDKNFGNVMKAVMAKVQGQADGGRVSALVKKYLS